MEAVVFNTSRTPISTSVGMIFAGEWRYLANTDEVAVQLADGRLAIAQAPADPIQINPKAREAFEQLRNSQNENLRHAEIARLRDTKVSAKKSKKETEA